MMEHPKTPIAPSADGAETPQVNPDEPSFGVAEKESKQEVAEDEAAEQLGNFA